jgi:hypothetical protein
MVTDDKTALKVDLENNVNSRDQRNVGIWVLVLVGLFVGFLVILGSSHAPNEGKVHEPYTAASQEGMTPGKNVESRTSDDPKFSVNAPVDEVERPGTIGQPQHFLTGHGNTPVPGEAENSATNAPNPQSGTEPQTTPAATPSASHPASVVPSQPAAQGH